MQDVWQEIVWNMQIKFNDTIKDLDYGYSYENYIELSPFDCWKVLLIHKGKTQNPQRVIEEHSSCHWEDAKGVVLVVLDGEHFIESTFLISAIS